MGQKGVERWREGYLLNEEESSRRKSVERNENKKDESETRARARSRKRNKNENEKGGRERKFNRIEWVAKPSDFIFFVLVFFV